MRQKNFIIEQSLSCKRTGNRRTEATALMKAWEKCIIFSVNMSRLKNISRTRHLRSSRKFGDRAGEATCCRNLGTVFHDLREYLKAKEYQQKALAIMKEIGDREQAVNQIKFNRDCCSFCNFA